MKTLIEILEEVKDGGRPEYDDLRYALLIMDFWEFKLFNYVLMDLYGKEKLDKFGKLRFEIHYKSRQKSFNMSPKQAIGSFDPDLPGRQEERAMHKKIGNKLFAADTEKGESHER